MSTAEWVWMWIFWQYNTKIHNAHKGTHKKKIKVNTMNNVSNQFKNLHQEQEEIEQK